MTDETAGADLLPENLLLAKLDELYGWGRKFSLWPLSFGLACCVFEFFATAGARWDFGRWGWDLARASPRQADVIVISGTVTKKMVPQVVRLYNQMAEPKYVIAMGACATGGGPFKEGYGVVSGVDEFLPVDVYVPGCPPTPEAFLKGLLSLVEQVQGERSRGARWYRRGPAPAVPLPLLGPDLIDPRQAPAINRASAAVPGAGGQAQAALPTPGTSWAGRMDCANLDTVQAALSAAVPGAVVGRDGDWLLLAADRLQAAATHLRDAQGYDYLTHLSATDYPDRFEVIYNLYATGGDKRGPGIPFKVQAGKAAPRVPSLAGIFKSADVQEREVWDLFGIHFEGHPNLRRILLWEGFDGHPLRKDWCEPYFQGEAKPWASRWPRTEAPRPRWAEGRSAWGRNVQYPPGFEATDWAAPTVEPPPERQAVSGRLETDSFYVNIGPQHPSTHGVFRMILGLDGELVTSVTPILGQLHRNHEKIGERNLWTGNIPYTDRLDYVCSMYNNFCYVVAVEKLMGVEVPERAEYLRVIMGELTRVINHMLAAGFMLNELGNMFTAMLYAFRAREYVLDLFEAVAGSRLMCNYYRFGGVARDVDESWLKQCRRVVFDLLGRATDEIEGLMTDNEILIARCRGVGAMSWQEMVSFGVSGPMLRSAGLDYDIRRVEPYSIYDRFDFAVPTHSTGDLYDRYRQRIAEARESVKILKQALDTMPAGGAVQAAKKAWNPRVPPGEVYSRVEHPKGELGFYLVSDGGTNPYRYHIRSSGFVNLGALEAMTVGHLFADAMPIFGSVDVTLGEVDR